MLILLKFLYEHLFSTNLFIQSFFSYIKNCVSAKTILNKILQKIFKHHLYELSCKDCFLQNFFLELLS